MSAHQEAAAIVPVQFGPSASNGSVATAAVELTKANTLPCAANHSNTTNGYLPTDKNLRLHFSHVSYSGKENNSKNEHILKDTCGEFRSGRLTAILGPSGAGKTSMLNVLSGFKANGVTGQFQVNDKERDLVTFRTLSSYIPQDFVMLNLLTVQETIKNSTDLKLPTKTSLAEKHQIIDDILKLLNMDKCRQTLVCNLSGGERKRLSIAIELVTNPPLMFFDEPTSGLDSVASLQVLSYLHRLAHDGRVIVCVVHQPSSRLMKLFDDVVVMSRGTVLYCGAQKHMLAWFEQAGFKCPQYYNPADFVLEVGSEQHDVQITSLIRRNRELYGRTQLSSGETITVDERTRMLPSEDFAHTSIEMHSAAAAVPVQITASQCCIKLRPKTQVSVWRQFCVLLQRSLRAMSRNLLGVQLRIAMHIVVAALLGIVFWDIGDEAAKMLTNSSCIFFLALFVFFANAMPSILLCPQETTVFIREYLNGWYSIWAYYMAKIISEIPMLLVCPTFFVGIVYFMTGQPPDLGRFVMCWGIGLVTGVVGHLMGLVFGATFQEQLAIFLVPTVAIPFMIFSGFFIRIHELGVFLRPLCDISFFRYTMEGFMQALYSFDRADLQCNAEFCYFKSPQRFLKEFDMWGDLYGGDVLALLVWVVILLVAFFLSLLLRIKLSQ